MRSDRLLMVEERSPQALQLVEALDGQARDDDTSVSSRGHRETKSRLTPSWSALSSASIRTTGIDASSLGRPRTRRARRATGGLRSPRTGRRPTAPDYRRTPRYSGGTWLLTWVPW